MMRKKLSAAELVVEMALDTGDYPNFVDPGRQRQLSRREHPYRDNPAFPQHQGGGPEDNYEERLTSEQYRFTLEKLQRYMTRLTGEDFRIRGPQHVMPVMQMAMQGLETLKDKEREHTAQLEELAIRLVFMLPEFAKFKEPYENDEFRISASLQDRPNMDGAEFSPEAREDGGEEGDDEGDEEEEYGQDVDLGEEEQAEEPPLDLDALKSAVHKRKFINAMIQGSAISKNYAFHLVQEELDAIDPALVNLYGLIMAFAEFGYFAASEQQQLDALRGGGGTMAGSSRLRYEESMEESLLQEGVYVIEAQGQIFPVLVQEIVKGMMEMVSMGGLPEDPRMSQAVLDQADVIDHEVWSTVLGRGLWNQYTDALQLTDGDLTMYLYSKLVAMPDREFNETMQTILGGGDAAKNKARFLLDQLRLDMAEQSKEDAGFGVDDEDEDEDGQSDWGKGWDPDDDDDDGGAVYAESRSRDLTRKMIGG